MACPSCGYESWDEANCRCGAAEPVPVPAPLWGVFGLEGAPVEQPPHGGFPSCEMAVQWVSAHCRGAVLVPDDGECWSPAFAWAGHSIFAQEV